ncbi:MAG: fibronectin type III domain-containing protein [Candidatus Paceibacterota bacterium]
MLFQLVGGAFLLPQEARADNVYFSDDFTGTEIDTSEWIKVDSSVGGTNLTQDGMLNVIGNSSFSGNALKTVNTYDRSLNDLVIEVDMTIADCAATNSGSLGYGGINFPTDSSYLVINHNGFITLYSTGDAVNSIASSFGCTNNVPFHIKLVILQSGGANLYINNSSTPDAALTQGTFTDQQIFLSSYIFSGVSYDNFVVYALANAPTNLQVVQGDNQASLSWDVSYDGGYPITDYVVEYRETGSGAFSVFDEGVSLSPSAIVTGLVNEKFYDFRVSPVNSNGVGLASDVVSTRTLSAIIFDNFTGTTIDTSKWTIVDSAGTGVAQNNMLTVSTDGTGLKTIDTFDRSLSDLIIESDMTISNCSATLTSGAMGYGGMDFPSDSSYMVVQREGVIKLYYSAGGAAISVASSFGCTNNVPFHIKLVVLQGGGANLYINNSSTPDATLTQGTFTNQQIFLEKYSASVIKHDNFVVYRNPSAPTNLQVVQDDSQVSLNWDMPYNDGFSATDYIIEYCETGAGIFSVFNDGISVNTSAIVTGLTNGKSYDFRVSASNVNGTGTASDVVSTIPLNSVPVAPVAASVNIIGFGSVGEVVAGRYIYSDSNADEEGDSIFRWLRADSAEGNYQIISGAIGKTYTLTEDDLDKYIKFEVTPVSAVSPYLGVSVLSLATSQINSADYLNHILSTGQSLSNGTLGSPALTTTQPFQNKTLSGSSLIDLTESSNETISSSMANFITSNTVDNGYQSVVTRHGLGATGYVGLKKGTTPYTNGISQATTVKGIAEGLNKIDRVIGVTVIHGETDAGSASGIYEGYLEEWQNDYNVDIKDTTEQSQDIPIFTDQMSSFTSLGRAISYVPIDQLAAYENNLTKIYLVGPKYFLNYVEGDGVHLTNTSYRWLGEYYGKVIKKVVVDKEEWKPLSPDQIYRIGNEVYAKFNVPEGPLQLDTSLVLAKANYGFEYYDAGSSASISSVEIISDDTVKVTLDSVPTGSDQRLRYAYTGTVGASAGADSEGSARGNLRDSDSAESQYGNTLYNWAVHFDKPITQDNTNPSIFPLSGVLTGTQVSNRRPTFYWNNSDDSTSGLSKYQLYVDEVLKTDNISPEALSASVSEDLACGDHTWYVKAFDNAGNSIKSYDTASLNINCGSGLISPTKPNITNIDITVLDNGNLTFDNLPDSITQIAISRTPDFANVSWEDMSKKEELFQQYAGADKYYIKFRTDQGAVSDVITCEGDKIGTIGEGTDTSDTIDNNNQGSSAQTLNDGDLVKTINSPDVYIIKYKNNKQYKRLILAPYIFSLYRHLQWENIKIISQEQLDQFTASNLIKESVDPIIYQLFPDGDTGQRKPLDPLAIYDPDSVYEINKPEQDSYEAMN